MEGWVQSRSQVVIVKLRVSLRRTTGEQYATFWLSEDILLSTKMITLFSLIQQNITYIFYCLFCIKIFE